MSGFFRAILITCARQVGKTTILKHLAGRFLSRPWWGSANLSFKRWCDVYICCLYSWCYNGFLYQI